MGRNARIGLFLLMGLVVALARLIEVEVGKARPVEEAPSTPSLVVKPPRPSPSPHTTKKTQRASDHAKRAANVSPAPVPAAAVVPTTLPAGAAKDEPEGVEWPKGPIYTVKKGETLGVIAQKVLGTSKLANRLYEANATRIANPHFVKPGTRLVVPAKD